MDHANQETTAFRRLLPLKFAVSLKYGKVFYW